MAAQTRCQLMELLVELRTTICDMVFDNHTVYPGVYKQNTIGLRKPWQRWSDAPALLISSKQIYSEAARIYYQRSIFHFYLLSSAISWLSALPRARQLLVGTVRTDEHTVDLHNKSRSRWSFWAEALGRKVEAAHSLLIGHGIPLPIGTLQYCMVWTIYSQIGEQAEWTSDPVRTLEGRLASHG